MRAIVQTPAELRSSILDHGIAGPTHSAAGRSAPGVVALAGTFPTTVDNAGLLKRVRNDRGRIAPRADHLREMTPR
jgi:hypothetical protein